MFILFFGLSFFSFLQNSFFPMLQCIKLAGKLVKNKDFKFLSTDFVFQEVWVTAKESSFLISMPGIYYGYDSWTTFLEILFTLTAHDHPFKHLALFQACSLPLPLSVSLSVPPFLCLSLPSSLFGKQNMEDMCQKKKTGEY